MQLSTHQQYQEALIKMAVLFYQVDGKITLTEQDYLDELLESLNWESPISRDAFVNDVIYQTRTAIDAGEASDVLKSLQPQLVMDASRAVEVATVMTGVDGERSDEETELLSLLTHKLLAKALTETVS
ncbi:TerB family tellurite resistance protein [Aestuariibacter sp. GS-14]|uniref:tellurite resistance TerB family protein n=1 Tax=Alteromonadaceae TaxID=72275 RepID=UPI00112EE73C|nr:TerB family tellurite resistance protein [Aestuariibacter sp. GS-14]TPV61740.1 TerB family tellurite resistance protein [Aestuariibacter sp. GS-14]